MSSKFPYIATRVYTFIEKNHRGRYNALKHEDLLAEMRCFDINLDERALRKICSTLPLCSCEDGVFFPMTVREVIDFQNYLTRNGGPFVASRRVALIYERFPKLRPLADVQNEIDFAPTKSVFDDARRRTIFVEEEDS